MTSSASPLFDTLFRPTTAVEQSAPSPHARPDDSAGLGASAAPVRVPGTRTRAGNAMNRTRAALLLGAGRAVAATGTKIAMAQVATLAGVAKATLYNHFRTRDAVLAALLLDQVQQLVDAHRAEPLDVALAGAARDIARNEVVRGLAAVEPAALAAIARIDDAAPAWALARSAVVELLAGAGRGGADTVLRWLASFLLSPAAPDTIAADVAVLVAGLPLAAPAQSGVAQSGVAQSGVAQSGVAQSGVAQSGVAHSDVAHSDVAHSDVAHSDVAHSDVAQSDVAGSTAGVSVDVPVIPAAPSRSA